ncbi:WD repeat protein, putative [Trichomonas vaginalis G3]|uniref:WD repeat protein, putative n=1 Tax=Trichomonas vaginalis (strain ATCC PRA-98 / G3) TaxID=412133 RepID=A2DZ09_TRIV3|nr:osmotic avoidance abnormal protein 1/WD repeat membrane protein family [Trichomonas vaginalis G3]EAY14285.1 WD repeat protein, putative [Trichomonas vaginalis G3]KAI5517304.1 osmotic avoidance abnormal protein 1/WD repeat membrane protein family [Trichomonas vaginalis G3]|eukprot:XP_001326508.1 WD repeat protein [Trichomonas vaginalis G3]
MKWSRDSKYLAVVGNNGNIFVYDRNGKKLISVPITYPKFLEWDSQSKYLIASSSDTAELCVVNVQTVEISQIEAPFIPTWLQCSKRNSFLAVGSDKGKFWICDLNSQQSQNYQGTHDSAIVDGAWNSKSHLALCSADQSISVSDVKGKVLARQDIGDTPIFPQFITVDSTLTLVFASSNSPTLYFWEYVNGTAPQKLAFEQSLGKIIKCITLTNSLVYVQFSYGKFYLVNFDSEIVVQRHAFPSSVSSADSIHTKALVGSGPSVKLINLDDPKNIIDEQIHFPDDVNGDVTSISLTSDGSLGSVGTDDGVVLVYLVEVPILSASNGTICVYSQSLTSLAVYDMHKKTTKSINVDYQPQKLGICPKIVASSFNNKCYFYDSKSCELISQTELSATIDSIQVSETAFAVLMGGKVMLNYFDKSKKPFTFPDFDTNAKVTSFCLTAPLLLLATDDGTVRIFNVRNQAFLDGYKHPNPIISIRANGSETRFIFIDSAHGIFIFNPIKRTTLEVTTSTNGKQIDASTAMFDMLDRSVFAVFAPNTVAVYHITDHNVSGPELKQLCTAEISNLKAPLGIFDGTLIFLDAQSTEQTFIMPSHNNIGKDTPDSVRQLLTIHRHRKALQVALKIGDKSLIKEVADSALSALAIEIAADAYACCGDACNYSILNPIKKEEEYSFLRGYVSMLNKDFNGAQKSFLESSRPEMALDMRSALLQFDSALQLAEKFDPSRIPQLSYESGRQNELTGNYSQAIQQYKAALTTPELKKGSRSGIIRCMILAGKVEQGMKQLEKTKDTNLVTECARILERLSAFSQAAQLYSQVSQFNSAAQCYVRANDLNSAANLVPKVDDSKVLVSIGKQLERAGQLEAATTAFERANDWESLVRVLLKVNLDRATAIARAHPTADACRAVAEHCIQLGNFRYAIEFLIIAGRNEDAFRIAELHQKMDELADLIGDNGTKQQYDALATYFSARNDNISAAKFYAKSGDPERAMNCYMADGSPEALDGALDLAEKVENKTIRDILLDYLSANVQSKDLRYLLRMFIIMKQFNEAAVTAMRIADDYRERGEYRQSRDILFDIYCQLEKHNQQISSEMKQSLMIIHSYLLIKPMKEYDRTISAFLLRRVSKFASKFPQHAANILASTVVECSRAGYKKSAYEAATKLISPEYEGKINPDLMKKIVQTVRHKNTSEAAEPTSPCPVCGADIPISELYCASCKTNIPYDVITGMHMTKDDWCQCPNCKFPSSHKLMGELKTCQICGTHVETPELIPNPKIV